jgi:hypothetical protein
MLTGAALQTTARQDFSHAWVVCNSSKTGQKGGDRQSRASSFLEVMSEVQNNLGYVFAGKGQFLKNPVYKNFVRNLM